MKFIKFKKIKNSRTTIIRVTYKNFFGKKLERDIIDRGIQSSYFIFCDTGCRAFNNKDRALSLFLLMDENEWIINKKR